MDPGMTVRLRLAADFKRQPCGDPLPAMAPAHEQSRQLRQWVGQVRTIDGQPHQVIFIKAFHGDLSVADNIQVLPQAPTH